jgi:dienelactone hydrolase
MSGVLSVLEHSVCGRVAGPGFILGRNNPLIDEPVSPRLTGVPRGQIVRLSASSVDGSGIEFRAWAEYRTGPDGKVDPARQRSRAGTYRGADPFGLWWSMSSAPELAFSSGLRAIRTELAAEISGELVAHAAFERLTMAPGVVIETVREGGLVATLFLPQSVPAPGIVVLGGSEGGLSQAEGLAALLASRGFTALALAYFGMAGLPAQLVEIPVEYVDAAILWLLARPEVWGDGVGLVGTSRGGELALLAASFCPKVRAVVGFAASGIVWQGFTPGATTALSAWTRGGRAMPCAFPVGLPARQDSNQPSSLLGCFLGALDRQRQIAKAEIPVERIQGPVLLISGRDDQMWPAHLFAKLVARRRGETGRRLGDTRLRYAHAGHAAGRLPGLPAAPTIACDPKDRVCYSLGGTKEANARSALDAWPRTLAFLRHNLGPAPAVGRSRR